MSTATIKALAEQMKLGAADAGEYPGTVVLPKGLYRPLDKADRGVVICDGEDSLHAWCTGPGYCDTHGDGCLQLNRNGSKASATLGRAVRYRLLLGCKLLQAVEC